MSQPADTATLFYFESEPTCAPPRVEITTVVPHVSQHASLQQQPQTAFLAREVKDWSPEDLRDYVATQIVSRFGVFPRDARKEHGIFHSFVNRWGITTAVAIARYAYEIRDGRWKGAPVRFERFCKNSDPYFAEPIAQLLVAS